MIPGITFTAPPEAWLGTTPHLVVMGTINGRIFDLQMTDMAKADGVAAFEGKREYLPGEGGSWLYGDFEVTLKATVDAVERALEMEFENRDFASHALRATFELQDANSPEGLKSDLRGWTGRRSIGWTATRSRSARRWWKWRKGRWTGSPRPTASPRPPRRSAFPRGLLVMMDDQNAGFSTNFKLTNWGQIAGWLPNQGQRQASRATT